MSARNGTDRPGEFPLAIVIPTYNRCETLIACLKYLENQTHKAFEVIVVDDGSTDETLKALDKFQQTTCLTLRILNQKNHGPARARNVAISMVCSPITLMIGDDIFATPRLVEIHLNLHLQNPHSWVSGLGLINWESQTQDVTRFMRFLDDGIQFAYPDLLAGKAPDWRYFYTSNLSVKTEVLRRNPFDEDFPYAAYEDTELGLRIARKEGLELVFLPEAIAYHYHPTTFLQACQRMRKMGWSAHLLNEKWPETRVDPPSGKFRRRIATGMLLGTPILALMTGVSSALSRFCCPKTLLSLVFSSYAALGYQERELHVNKIACKS